MVWGDLGLYLCMTLENLQPVKILAKPAGSEFTQEEVATLSKTSPVTYSAVAAQLEGWDLRCYLSCPHAIADYLTDYGNVELMNLIHQPGTYEFYAKGAKLVDANGVEPARKTYPHLNLEVKLWEVKAGVAIPPECPDRCLVVNCRTNTIWTCGYLNEDKAQVKQGKSGKSATAQNWSKEAFWRTMDRVQNGSVLIVKGDKAYLDEIFAEMPKLELPDFMRKLQSMKDMSFDPFEL